MLKIGVIGGGLGLRCIIPKFKEIDGVTVFAFLSGNYKKTKIIGKENNIQYICRNIEEMCRLPVDLICIASPTKFHYEQVNYILSKNINILCEKPLAISKEEIDKLISKFKGTQSLCLIDLELRFNPYFQKIKELIKSIGQIYHVEMRFESDLYLNENVRNSWAYDAESGGGIRLAIMPHFLDLLFYWINADCVSLRGYLTAVSNEKNLSDFCLVHMQLDKDITVCLSASALVKDEKRMEIEVLGTHGKITFDLLNGLRLNQKIVDVELPNFYNCEESIFRSSFGCYARKIVSILNNKARADELTSVKEMVKIHKLLNDIKISANSGHEIVYKEKSNLNS